MSSRFATLPGLAKATNPAEQEGLMERMRQIIQVLLGRTRQDKQYALVTFDDLIGLGLVTEAEVAVYLQKISDSDGANARKGAALTGV